jgi:DNA-directed RNA polymerase subunit RPC12/RpoP
MLSDKTPTCPKCKQDLSPESVARYKMEHPGAIKGVPCPYCKKRIDYRSQSCVHCGAELSADDIAKSQKTAGKRFGVIAVIVIALLIYGLIAGNKEDKRKAADPKPKAVAAAEKSTEDKAIKLPVQNSPWDGSVWQVKAWMKENLDDPKSIEYVDWSPLSKSGKGNWMVRTKFRAKNRLGALVLSNWVFYLDEDGKVLEYRDVADIVE